MYIINDIEPFLTIFQTERPLAVFVYGKMKELIVALMTQFIRPEILETHSSVENLMKIDLTQKGNLLPSESVKVGFGAKKILSNLPTVQAPECGKFKQQEKCFLIKIVEKIQERSPLKYSLSLYLSSLSPKQITSVSDEVLGERFDNLLEHLDESGWISSTMADRAQSEYRIFIKDRNVMNKMSSFDIGSDRVDQLYFIDQLYFSLINNKRKNLYEIIKPCMILSHGNARLEAGFSFNEQILEVNMKESSVVNQRIYMKAFWG